MTSQDLIDPLELEKQIKKLRQKNENKVCIDCNAKNPDWCSLFFGVWVCIDCSGPHRSMGVHVTLVKSSTLDQKWTRENLKFMQLGGNGKARAYFQKTGIDQYKKIEQKYKTLAAKNYKKELKDLVDKDLSIEGGIKSSLDTESTPDEIKSAPPKMFTKGEQDEQWDFVDSIKKEVEKKEQYKIVQTEEKEKIVIQDKKRTSQPSTPTKKLPMGPMKEIPKVETPYKTVKKEEKEDDWEWKESTKIEEEDDNWDNNWDNGTSKKMTPVTSTKEKPLSNTKTKFVGVSKEETDIDVSQLEALRRKKREDNASFFELSNESKIEYVKDTAKELGKKTVEISGEVYEKVSDFGEQVGDVVGKWWNGLMQQ